MRNLFILILPLVVLSACSSVERLAIPKSELVNPSFRQTGENNQIDHAEWNQFLQTYTQKDNDDVVRINYAQVSDVDHQALKSYIKHLTDVNTETLSQNSQLAYWANLYNALTVDVILDNYPIDSIRNIKDGFFDLGPWNDKRLTIAGQPMSLFDIEHGVVRPLWADDPRIHYILNCGAAGCPNLNRTAFTAENIQEHMQAAAIAYVNNSRGVDVQDDGRIVASKIYSWYLGDFGGSNAKILEHLETYAKPELKAALLARGGIDAFDYDWSLNDTKRTNTLEKITLPAASQYN